jgi:TRAP transporter TAXI family solute receptor
MHWRGLTVREWIWLIGPWLLGLAAMIFVINYFWQPAPPRNIVMATGAEGGAAHRAGERYRDVLAKRGITVELKTTNGSLENRAKLLDDESGVSAAFVQTGSGTMDDAVWLSAIAGIYPEPLWIFYRHDPKKTITQVSELAGKKIAIGSRGSGTRRVAVELFAAYGIDIEKQPHSELNGIPAATALLKREVDAVAVVTGEDSAQVQSLLREPDIRLLGFPQSAALSRHFPHLTTVKLAPGMIDLAKNIPPEEVPLIAAMSQLIVRNDLHPALIRVLAEAAKEIHHGSGWFHKAGDFPTTRGTDVPIHADADRYFTSGVSFLQRHLPFWVSVWVERALILLVPLLAIGIPAARLLPAIYNWRMRERVYRWYAEVRHLDTEAMTTKPASTEAENILNRLNKIEARADNVRVPLAFARELYDLKVHIDFVRRRLQ